MLNSPLDAILGEIDQMKIALRNEQCDDTPNENTILAIKDRLRSLDRAAHRRIVTA